MGSQMVEKVVPLSENQLTFSKITFHDFYPPICSGILIPKHSESASGGNKIFVDSHLFYFKLGAMFNVHRDVHGNQFFQRGNVQIIYRAGICLEHILKGIIFRWTFLLLVICCFLLEKLFMENYIVLKIGNFSTSFLIDPIQNFISRLVVLLKLACPVSCTNVRRHKNDTFLRAFLLDSWIVLVTTFKLADQFKVCFRTFLKTVRQLIFCETTAEYNFFNWIIEYYLVALQLVSVTCVASRWLRQCSQQILLIGFRSSLI